MVLALFTAARVKGSMNKIQQLERELAEAKLAEQKESRDNWLRTFNEKYAGKCFIKITPLSGGKAIALWSFGRGTLDRGDARVVVNLRRQYLGFKHHGIEAGVVTARETFTETDSTLWDLTPVSSDVFERWWLSARVASSSLFEALVKDAQAEERNAQVESCVAEYDHENKVDNTEVDFEFLQLSPHQCLFFAKSPFMMTGGRYLLTPAGRADGLARLHTAGKQLFSGSRHFEECDMRYVNSQSEEIRRLIEKLSAKGNDEPR